MNLGNIPSGAAGYVKTKHLMIKEEVTGHAGGTVCSVQSK